MRKLFIALVASVSLASCSTTQVQQAEQFIGQVQAYAAQVCHFVPEVATVVSIWNATVGATVAGVGGAICALVPPPASAKFGALPPVDRGFAPAVVGVTKGGIAVSGWRTQ